MDKVSGEELIHVSGIKDFQKENGVCKIRNDMAVH
jgi:hypothetical protein